MPHKILSPYHPHPLYAQHYTWNGMPYGLKGCHACGKQLENGIFYACRLCNIDLDATCASFIPSMEDLHHFIHFHPLTLDVIDFRRLDSHYYGCDLCKILHIGRIPAYVCSNCKFYACQKCCMLKLPLEIQNPSHQCFLTLDRRIRTNGDHIPLNYRCENCKFTTKFGQALKDFGYKGGNQFYHFSHRHPLELMEQNYEEGSCSACGKSCSSPTYGCITCQYFLHQTCIDLSLEIRHFFHPCTLFLRIQPKSFSCGACDRTIQGFYFHCEPCNFSMDIECALQPTRQSQSDEVQFFHSSHGHPLTLYKMKDNHQFYCSVCRRCSSGPAFECRRCRFFLDKSCFDHLQPQIQYAFHSHHQLFLQGMPTKVKSVCNVCCRNLRGPTYRCLLCEFEMHMECTLIMPTVSYEGHNHLLFILENIETQVKCYSCNNTCDSCVFHCVECDFNLHLPCGPLPLTIEHECHYHPFILTNSPLEDESDQFCCDVCEKDRDPLLPVYYCKGCLFPAEVKCLISEVVLTLKGHYGEVELGTPDGQINGKVTSKSLEVIKLEPKKVQNSDEKVQEMRVDKPSLNWKDILKSFKENEKIELKDVLGAPRWRKILAADTSSSDPRSDSEVSLFSCSDLVIAFSGDENMVLAAPGSEITDAKETPSIEQQEYNESNKKLSLFAEKSYELFMKKLDSGTNYSSLTFCKGNEEVINVRGYLIPQKLAPILQKLGSKYGDVSQESTLISPRVKNYLTVMLCGNLHSICNTRTNEISENLLLNWWNNFKKLKRAGFKVQFAFDHLEKVARAYFGLQVEKFEAELDKKVTDLSAAIEQLTTEREALNEKRKCIALEKDKKSSIIKDCLLEASDKRWHLCGMGLL